jgi:predicted nucleic acid-binding protein
MFIAVVDTNILFSLFWKNSFTSKLVKNIAAISPERALLEIINHKKEILEKAGITKEEFHSILENVKTKVVFVPRNKYKDYLVHGEALHDFKDSDFLALAIYTNNILWSLDSKLKEQDVVDVVNTKEMTGLIANALNYRKRLENR